MTPPTGIGISSGTFPRTPPGELAARVRELGGTGVDLRIGKGQEWDRAGVEQGLTQITQAGVEVFFTGVGWRLGDPALTPSADQGVPAHRPVKVFSVASPDPALVADQVAAAREAGLELWVETHAGGPSARDLIDMAAATGVGVLLDTLGLDEIGGADERLLADLAPHVRAAQVKGFERGPEGPWHRPLTAADLAPVLTVMHHTALRAVTLESRAGTPRADMALLTRRLACSHVTDPT